MGITVFEPSKYSVTETLRNGQTLEVRAFRPEDRPGFLAAVERVGPRSRYLRFFSLKRDFTDKERSFFLNVDFHQHVALVGLVEEADGKSIAGSSRYVLTKPATAEVAFTVVDKYQGQGIGSALLRHLIIVAREAGLDTLIAEVLPENKPMLHLFEGSGLPVSVAAEPDVVHVTMRLR